MEEAQKEELKRPISTEMLPKNCRPNSLATNQVQLAFVFNNRSKFLPIHHQ